MNSCLRAITVCLLAGAASLGCSAGPLPQETTDETGAAEPVASIEQGVDQACINQCMRGCVCSPDDGKPAVCRRMCQVDCNEACAPPPPCAPTCAGKACGASNGCGGLCSAGSCPSGTTCGGGGVLNQCGCTPSCTGKACGASNGCGGTCNTGSCPGGAVCGGGGVAGMCALPNLNGVVTGTVLASPFITKQVRFDILVRNMGPVDANNVELLFQTNVPAAMSTLITSNGFVCHSLPAYSPRLGLSCTGGNIGRFNTASIQLTLALSTPGYNVLSMIADPNNAIIELEEADNAVNGGVFL